jgi:hypothetical protein
VIPRHEEIDPVFSHQIDEPVLLRDPPRPAALQVEAQGLGLADPLERITQNLFDELQDA